MLSPGNVGLGIAATIAAPIAAPIGAVLYVGVVRRMGMV